MDIGEIDIPNKLKEILEENGIKKLNPVQILAIENGLLELKNSFVISAPTASGKTMIAELFMIKSILEKRCKALYIVPLKALANEKFEDFKKYEKTGLKIAISTSDYDSSDNWLQDFDIIVLTSEKADSLLRHKAHWMRQVGIVVIDEIHLINDNERGPTLEIAITKLKRMNPWVLFLFLSATIKNANELAEWINAKLIESKWRPVKLYEGVYDGEKVEFVDKDDLKLKNNGKGEFVLTEHTMKIGKQNIIFASTRRNAESIAENCGKIVEKYLSKKEREFLEKLSQEIENSLENPTKQCKRLAKCIRNGVAFHHAGLVGKQRKLIEDAFRKGFIKTVAATPTLAAGINMPAFRVLIRDAKRYYSGFGYSYIPVLEYQQMAGRSGRPRYDSFGEAILIGKNTTEAEELKLRYIHNDPEPIYSKLAIEPVLRSHILALIASDMIKTEDDLYEFFSETFYGYQFGDIYRLSEIIKRILNYLIEWRFVVQIGKELKVTKIGKRVSELYIDPESAHKIIESIENYRINEFGLLCLISGLRELSPQLSVKNSEYSDMELELEKRYQKIMANIPEEWEYEYEKFLSSLKTAILFESWINEVGEDKINSRFNITPGELYGRVEIAKWLLYATHELAFLLGKKDELKIIKKLYMRMKYGVKEELVPLVKLRGIGRVRARMLYEHGFRKISDLKKAKTIQIAEIVGPKVAERIKEQIEK